jgi:hypothetical protein
MSVQTVGNTYVMLCYAGHTTNFLSLTQQQPPPPPPAAQNTKYVEKNVNKTNK